MGLRSSLKQAIKSALGRERAPEGTTAPAGAMPTTAATPSSPPSPRAPSPRAPAPPAPSPPAPAPTSSAPAARASSPASPAPPPAPASAAPPPSGAPPAGSGADAEKIRKHHLKTKAGMLRWLEEQGGAAHMGPMHDHSERRYFVAHRAFSNLMEELTGEELVLYDAESGMVTLTPAGRAWKT